MIQIYSFDPGLITGWCHLTVDNEIEIFECGEADHQQIGNMLYDNPVLKSAIENQEIETVFITEKFIMNSKITQSPWSLETVGLIRYFANHYNATFDLVTPSAHKNLIGSDVIKRAGLWNSGKGHAMDAVSIALYFLIVKRKLLVKLLKGNE